MNKSPIKHLQWKMAGLLSLASELIRIMIGLVVEQDAFKSIIAAGAGICFVAFLGVHFLVSARWGAGAQDCEWDPGQPLWKYSTGLSKSC